MSKTKTDSANTDAPTTPTSTPAPKKKRIYTFPDIDGGGPAVTIEATSLQEATELFKKGQATA